MFLRFLSLLAVLAVVYGVPTSPDEPKVNKKSYSGYKLLRTNRLGHSRLAEALMLSLDGKHGKALHY